MEKPIVLDLNGKPTFVIDMSDIRSFGKDEKEGKTFTVLNFMDNRQSIYAENSIKDILDQMKNYR